MLRTLAPTVKTSTEKTQAKGVPERTDGKRILVVDDNRDTANTMSLLLRK